MSKIVNKNIYRGTLIVSFIALNALIIYGISAVLAYLNTGAERTTMLHTAVESKTMYLPNITWEDKLASDRPMEAQTLKELQNDYLNAWYIKSVALQTNLKNGIENYYTDSARVHIFNQIKYNKNHNIHIESTTTNHNPELYFYSQDKIR